VLSPGEKQLAHQRPPGDKNRALIKIYRRAGKTALGWKNINGIAGGIVS